jgi:hypothetical protein
MRRAAALLVSVVALTACGGGGKASAPTTTDKVARADRYLELVEPVNCAIATANQVSNTSEMRTAAIKIADTERAFAEGLRAERWEPTVQPSVDKLAAIAAAQAEAWKTAASSNSPDDWQRHVEAIDLPAGAEASAEVRAKLGLAEANAATPCPGHGG